RCFATSTPTATISPLSLHDALPILVLTLALAELFSRSGERIAYPEIMPPLLARNGTERLATALLQQKTVSAEPDLQSLQRFNELDRKSTRLNSSHVKISYAVFCLKK